MIEKEQSFCRACDTIILVGVIVMVIALPLPGKAALKSWGLLVPVAGWLAKMVYQRKLLIDRTPLDIPLTLAFIVIFISCIRSIRVPYSFNEFQNEFLWHFTLFYLITSNLKKDNQLKLVFWSFLVSYFWVAIYGIVGFYAGFGIHGDGLVERRAESIMGHPDEGAFFFALLVPFVLGVCIYEKKIFYRIVFGLFIISSLFFIILTYSRAGWLSTGLAITMLLLKKWTRFLIIVLIILIISGPFMPQTIVHRITSKTIGDRVFLWKSAICMIADYPLLGIGYGNKNFQQLYPRYSFYGIQEGNLQNAHNFYLQILVELGMIGALVFLSIFKSIIYHSWKTYKQESDPFRKGILLGGLGMILAFLVFSITTWRYENDTGLLFWIMVSMLIVLHNTQVMFKKELNGISCCAPSKIETVS